MYLYGEDLYNELVDLEEREEYLDEDEQANLVELRELENYLGLLKNVGTLISEDEFEDYAREYAADLHGNDLTWPLNHIDWEEATHDLSQDYTEVEYRGVTYLVNG